jgi:hypothetical protein
MLLTTDQCEPDDLDDLTVYPSLYAYAALCSRYDETPLDALVRQYYCINPLQAALEG